MTENIVELKLADKPKPINHDAIEMVEGLLERLKSGETYSVALVEVYADSNTVATAWSKGGGGQFHQLNSGVSILAYRLAKD